MAQVKVFNYGAHSARDYWNLVAKPDLGEFHRLRSPISVAHVVQSLWGLLEWYAQEQGSEAKCYYPLLPELEWIRDIAYSAKHRALGRKLTTKHMGYPNTGALAYGAGGYGVGPGGYSNSEPVVILDDGTTHKLIDLIPKIEAFWQARFPSECAPAVGARAKAKTHPSMSASQPARNLKKWCAPFLRQCRLVPARSNQPPFFAMVFEPFSNVTRAS